MTRTWTIAAALLLALAGCGPNGGNSGRDAGTDRTDAVEDTEPPEFRDIQISIQGEFSSNVDLTDGDASRILPVPADAEFKVLAGDNETSREDLELAAVTSDGEELSATDESFRNGLWSFTAELAPGDVVRVRATDAAGNAATSEHALTISTREGALVATWEKRFFTNDEQPEIREKHLRTFEEDGTWSEERVDVELGGDYRVEDETLVVQKTYQSGGGNENSDRSTIELDRASEFYVDRRFFSGRPWSRDGSKTGIAGTWEREAEIYTHESGERSLAETVRETLELTKNSGGPNEWAFTRDVTDADSEETTMETASGTWETVELTSIYGDNFGTFLVRTTEKRDGSELQDPETDTELYRMPLNKLLISPYVRSSMLAEGSR